MREEEGRGDKEQEEEEEGGREEHDEDKEEEDEKSLRRILTCVVRLCLVQWSTYSSRRCTGTSMSFLSDGTQQHATLGTATRALLERLPKETWINVLRFAEDVDQCAMCDKLVASFSRPGTRQAAQCVDCDFLATSLCSMCIDVWEKDVWEDQEDRDRRALEIQSHPGFLQEHAGALCVRCHGYLCAGCLHPDCDTPEGMMCGECLGHAANACPYPMTSHCYC